VSPRPSPLRPSDVMRTHTVVASPIGDLTLIAEDGLLVALHMDGAKHVPGSPDELGERDDSGLADATGQLAEYFACERTTFDLPLAPVGNAFEQKVWALLREIPYGETRSYGDLARALGDVGFSQAVGAANGRNPLAIIVPIPAGPIVPIAWRSRHSHGGREECRSGAPERDCRRQILRPLWKTLWTSCPR